MSKPVKIFNSLSIAEQALPIDKPKKLQLDGYSYLIVRTRKGIFVSDNLCPHNKASLNEGIVNGYNEIICPLHEYRFDLQSGRESSQRCMDMQTFKIRVEDDGVFLLI